MNLIKEFFYFTKSKLVVFILLAGVSFYLMVQQGMVLGNFAWSGLSIALIVLYFLLDILWFSFKDGKHFLIGLAAFALLLGVALLSGDNSAQKRAEAEDSCRKETNSVGLNGEVMRCMSAKGYKYYR